MSNNTESMQNKAEGGKNESKDLAEQIGKLVDQAKALQDSAAALTSKVGVEEEAIRKKALAVESDIKRLRSALASSLEKDAIDHREVEKLEEELFRARCMMSEGDVSALLPSKAQGSFLKMFLGPINVRALRNDVRLKVKEEYNNYRDRTAVLFLLFPCILLVLKNWIWDGCIPAFPVQLYQAWLLFFYTSLVLRENILRVNGSDIRPWWIYHHYCAMVMALVSLTWEIKGQPGCVQKQQGVRLFLTWAVMQGVAMLLQNRYQRQRLYTRIALGKARRMDVVWGETAGVKGQLWLLYPILFILQELPHPLFQQVDLRLGWICQQSSDGTMILPFFRGSWAFRIVKAPNCGSAGPNRGSDTVPQAGTVRSHSSTTVPKTAHMVPQVIFFCILEFPNC